MYERVGVSPDKDILKEINFWDNVRREKAHAIIRQIEEQALQNMSLMKGALELGRWCEKKSIPMALVTRNTASSVAYFHKMLWSPNPHFNPAVARDSHADLAHKPNPSALLFCSKVWRVPAHNLVMIGK